MYCMSFTLVSACVKEHALPARINMVQAAPMKVDYRLKWAGKYTGPNTDWQFVMGQNTTWIADSSLVDEYSLDPSQDSVMLSKHFGTFTVSANGKAAVTGWKTYKALVFRNDSVYYTYSDWSALGGSFGNHYDASKNKN